MLMDKKYLIEKGTRVIVNQKSHGCTIDDLFERHGNHYPKETPFFGWIGKMNEHMENETKDIYVIAYSPAGSGGDYYSRADFTIFSEEFITDGEILI